MLFNSYEFIYIFLPIVFLIYWASVKYIGFKARMVLCIASVVFYSFLALEYLPLLISSIAINYMIGSRLCKKSSKLTLFFGVGLNILAIVYYKYFDLLFVETLHLSNTVKNTVIPLGISFYTFTQIAYLVDSYNKKTGKDTSFISYFLFVTYFPHLIAGPILHHKEMLDQFSDSSKYIINYKNLLCGIIFFVFGLSKKVLIADHLISYVSPIFKAVSNGRSITPLEAWCGALAYTFQLYFDFSGYSDMAIGISKLFNFNLPFNFNSPYRSENIIDFWRRWHISLSTFLRDYLYIPLGGNRKGSLRRYENLLLTMLIGGAWHGASWTFILWGGYHGMLLSLNHLFKPLLDKIRLPKIILSLVTFILVVLGWVIFRSESVNGAIRYYRCLFNFKEYLFIHEAWFGSVVKIWSQVIPHPMPFFYGKYELINLVGLWFLCYKFTNSQQIVRMMIDYKHSIYTLIITHACLFSAFVACLFRLDSISEFIYFQF